jgi:hypothetical protein
MTFFCAVFFLLGIGALARLTHHGVELSILIPIIAAAIPLTTVVVGIIVYGESASPLKIGLLLVACLSVGWAATLQ